MPFEIELTMQPMCVQTALNALKSPEFGWVTTIFSLVKILPLPTGISLVVASAEACVPAVLPLVPILEFVAVSVYVPDEPGVVMQPQGGPGNGFCPPGQAKKGNC